MDSNRICSLSHQNCTTIGTLRNTVCTGMHQETPTKGTRNDVTEFHGNEKNQRHTFFKTKEGKKNTSTTNDIQNFLCAKMKQHQCNKQQQMRNMYNMPTCAADGDQTTISKTDKNEQERPNMKTASTDSLLNRRVKR